MVDDEAPATILGFYSLSVCVIVIEELPEQIQKPYRGQRELFGAKLGRVAVSKDLQGRGYGKALMAHAMKGVCSAANEIGLAVFFVDAKSERLVSYYEKFGFIRCCGEQPLRLFIPVSAIQKALIQAASGASCRTLGG